MKVNGALSLHSWDLAWERKWWGGVSLHASAGGMAEANPHFAFGPFLKPTQNMSERGNWHGKKNGQTILKRREDTISQRAREQRGGYTISHFRTDNKKEESTLVSSERNHLKGRTRTGEPPLITPYQHRETTRGKHQFNVNLGMNMILCYVGCLNEYDLAFCWICYVLLVWDVVVLVSLLFAHRYSSDLHEITEKIELSHHSSAHSQSEQAPQPII